MASTGAALNRGGSRQDYGTPREFIEAVENRFGRLAWDLAATKRNAKAPRYINSRQDSLSVNWSRLKGNQWLNPPFGNIEPWAAKCAFESRRGASILFLVPASVGSLWFRDHVLETAFCEGLSPRLVFEGETTGYPKDLMLCRFGPMVGPGFGFWRWKE